MAKATKNQGLGRGLSALISSNTLDIEENKPLSEGENATQTQENTPLVSDSPIYIPISEIDPNREQPRKIFNEEALRELAESIKLHGIIQPLVVNKMGSRYMIIAGERRYRASIIAGLTQVPAIVKNYSQQEIREISLIENLQREDLNPIEAARAIKALMEEFGLTQDETAKRIGKNRSTIANTMRLLTLDHAVISLVEQGRLSAGHARALIPIESKEVQRTFALKAEEEGLSVRNIEQMVKDYLNPSTTPKKEKQQPSVELKSLVLDMQRVFATKVSCASKGDKGRIYIDFYSKDDLDRIVDLVNKWMKDNM